MEKNNDVNEKRCALCNKPYNYKYKMFGRGCLDNLYELLEISKPPKFIWNKETYLCTRIAWKNHKFFLNKNKKYALTQKYIALNYLNRMNCKFLDDIKEEISKDIKNISVFSRNIIDSISFKLNDIYKLFNDAQRFNEIIKDMQNITWEEVDEKIAENFIKSISFIFNITKKTNPISYAVFYSMQYTFWQIVVIGGMLKDKKLSAILLSNSLSLPGIKPKDLILQDSLTDKLLKDSKVFNETIKELIEKYGKEREMFDLKDYEKNGVLLKFEGGDLLYSLHKATMFVKARKNEDNTWNLEGDINDKYDFTEFKDLNEYADNKEEVLTDMLSTLLNNFGVVSSEYGVIKTYNVKIKFEFSKYKIK